MKFKIEIQDKDYLLYYTRDAIVRMEREGFNATQMESQIVTSLRLLFWGALIPMNARLTLAQSDALLDEALKEYELSDLFEALVELFNDAFPKSTEGKKKKLVKIK